MMTSHICRSSLIAMLGAIIPASAQLPGVNKLLPTGGSFSVNKSAVPVIVHAFQISGPHMYFLVSPHPNPISASLVTTDLSGRIERSIQLGDEAATDFAADTSGAVFVRFEASSLGHGDVLKTYGSDGKVIEQPRDLSGFGAVAAVKGRAVGVTASGSVVRLPSQTAPTTAFRISSAKHADSVFPFRDHEIISVDRSEAELRIIDTETGLNRAIQVKSPEIEEAKFRNGSNDQAPNVRYMALQASTADEKGRIYVLPTGFKPADGAPVLVLDAEGHLVERLRCEFLRIGNGKWPLPVAIGVAKGRLYLVDVTGSVIVYPLGR